MLEGLVKFLFNTDAETIHIYTNPIKKMLGILPKPFVELGTLQNGILPLPFILSGTYAKSHTWIMGKTRTGKSKLLADIGVQNMLQGIPTAIVDPHQDLGSEVLIQLQQSGALEKLVASGTFLYIDFGMKDESGTPTYFVPFNILNQPGVDTYEIASVVVEAMRRTWPYLRASAPHFENVMFNTLIVLIDNNLTLAETDRLLTDKGYREKLLQNTTDKKVKAFFTHRYNEWQYQQMLRESTLNKTTLFTFTPVLRYSLGATDNMITVRRFMREGISVVYNLSGVEDEAQKLLGCFLTVLHERAAEARESILDRSKRRAYHLIIDEFDKFSAQSEQALADILAKCLKFRLFLTLANQTLSQTTETLLGALQNCATFMFTLGAKDAEKMATWYCDYEPSQKTHEVEDEVARRRTHPHAENPEVTHEGWKRLLSTLPQRTFLAIIKNRRWRVRTRTLPPIRIPWQTIESLQQQFAMQLLIPREKAYASEDRETITASKQTQTTVGRDKQKKLA